MDGTQGPGGAPPSDAGQWRPPPPPGGPSWTPAPPAGTATQTESGYRAEYAWVMAGVFPVVSVLLLSFAWSFLNQPAPETTMAGAILFLLLLVFAGAIALVVWSNPPSKRRSLWLVFLPAGLLAVPAGLILRDMLQDMYGMWGEISFFMGMGTLLAVVLPIHGVLLIVAWIVRTKSSVWAGDRVAQFSGLTTGGMFSVAGLFMLLTLREQERLAREAHETPGLSIVLILLVFVSCLLWARKARDAGR